jgi:hypothetical protein
MVVLMAFQSVGSMVVPMVVPMVDHWVDYLVAKSVDQ